MLAQTHMNLGQVSITKGRYEEAVTDLKEAGTPLRGAGARPARRGPRGLGRLARSQAILGIAYTKDSKFEKAEEAQQQALQVFEKLAREHPDVQAFAYDVGRCYTEMAKAADEGGRPAAARARYDKAIGILEGVLSKGYRAAHQPAMRARIGRAVTFALGGNSRPGGRRGGGPRPAAGLEFGQRLRDRLPLRPVVGRRGTRPQPLSC